MSTKKLMTQECRTYFYVFFAVFSTIVEEDFGLGLQDNKIRLEEPCN